MSEQGVGGMPSPVMPPLGDEDQLSKDTKENRDAGVGAGPSTGGSEEDAIDVDKIAAKAEEVKILEPERLTDVYKFTGVLEFVELPMHGRMERKSKLKSWKDIDKNGHAAIDLFQLSNWFKDFRFSAMVHPPPLDDDDGKEFWHFGLFVINPKASSLSLPSHEHYQDRVHAHQSFVREFYSNGFIADEATKESIHMATETETTIMILGKHVIRGKTAKKKEKITLQDFYSMRGVKVIAAITFRRCMEEEEKTNVSCAVSWLLIARHDTVHPSEINGWRRQGLGLFMFVCMIKHCYVVGSKADLVNIYLQCVEAKALNFYLKLGFQQINGKYDDGFQDLPIALQNSYKVGVEEDAASVFHFFDIANKNKEGSQHATPMKLLELKSGYLRHFKETVVNVVASANKESTRFWCEYPPPKLNGQHVMQVGDDFLKKKLKQIPYMKWLLPSPYECIIPHSGCYLKGGMLLVNRVQHSEMNGGKWMASPEIDLMLATLLMDGRYQDFAFIVSAYDSKSIKLAFKAYVDYMGALDLVQQKGNIEHSVIAKRIRDKYDSTLQELSDKYLNLRNSLLKSVVHVNPGILSRRVIIIPCNENNNHWSATFVFNASCIVDQEPRARACFFRYCSYYPDGSREVEVEQGIAWFLNLCYSYDAHERTLIKNKTSKFEWVTPFSDLKDGFMLGTEEFPSLRLPQELEVLPVQMDDFNCGIGICAAIAIILRDLVYVDQKDDKLDLVYEGTFSNLETFVCSKNKEVYCAMPHAGFKKLLMPRDKTWSDFLPLMREQWFSFIDLLADFQYVTEPYRHVVDYKIPDDYQSTLDLIKDWPTKKKFVIPNSPRKDPADKNKGDGDNKTDEDDDKVTSDKGDAQKPKRKLMFDPATAVIRVNGKLVKGSEEDLKKAKRVTDINYPIEAQFVQLKGLKPQNVGDEVEGNAFRLLKMMRKKDPIEAAEFDAALAPWPTETDKMCTQTKAHMEGIVAQYGSENISPPVLNMEKWKEEKEEYIELSFIEWGWHSNEEHETYMKALEEKIRSDSTAAEEKERLKMYARALRLERSKFRKHFSNEFKFTQKTMVHSVKYERSTNRFLALLVWQEGKAAQAKNEVIEVQEAWVKEQFGEVMLQQIINMRQEDYGWTQAPRDVAVFIGKWKIARVKYLPKSVRFITDVKLLTKKLKKLETMKEELNSKSGQKKKGGNKRKHPPQDYETQRMNLIQKPPKKKTSVEASWIGKTENGEKVALDENFVRTAFGDIFCEEIMALKRGFVDIPVGDYKPSRLMEHPHLCVNGACDIKFRQSEGKDLCVTKSLASAFYAMGWHDQAFKIDGYGEEILQGAVVEGIDRVGQYAKKIFPPWVVIRLLPKEFDYRTDLQENDLVLGALMASDGICSHAITIHGSGFIFDANESVALPLGKEALDYCTSTAQVKSEFVRFKRGWSFRYEGKKPSKVKKMMLMNEEDTEDDDPYT